MSLVGSLEDLGLGDILQIISLSGKSGVLQLRAEEGEGRILFDQGRIRLAYLGSAEPSLASLSTDGSTPVGEERDECLRQLIEHTVYQMFTWSTGEFSFEVCDATDGGDESLFLDPGVNPQFLALEGTRIADEQAAGMGFGSDGLPPGAVVVADPAEEMASEGCDPLGEAGFGSEPDFAVSEFSPAGPDVGGSGPLEMAPHPDPGLADACEPTFDTPAAAELSEPLAPEVELTAEGPCTEAPEIATAFPETPGEDREPRAPHPGPASPGPEPELQAAALASRASDPAPTDAGPSEEGTATAVIPPPIVFVDPERSVVEWARSSLPEDLPALHLFQSPDQGIQRIRQYLRRAQVPVVVLSTQLPPDSLSGARSPEELVARLRKQAPHMKIVLLEETGRPLPPALEKLSAHALRLCKPNPTQLADPRLAEARERLGAEFASGVLQVCGIATARPEPPPAVEELRQVSARLRDSSTTGDILPQVLSFAARVFPRVALFVVRDEEVQGLAQVGLPTAGGPEDSAFRQIGLHTTSSSWLRKVIESRVPLRARLEGLPADPGDAQLIEVLAQQTPQEIWLAPIVSSDRVVALLYADRLPESTTLGDTAALEVVLHHAGLALDRTALERALDGPRG